MFERKISEEQEANWAKRNVYTTEFETFNNINNKYKINAFSSRSEKQIAIEWGLNRMGEYCFEETIALNMSHVKQYISLLIIIYYIKRDNVCTVSSKYFI